MENMANNQDPVVYQTKNGAIELRSDAKAETVWASQSQIAELFDIDQSVASRHVRNVFRDGEVGEKGNMQKMHIPNSDKPVAFYSLDVILAVGYRTNSSVAISFRKWATKLLKQYVADGYAINPSRIQSNYERFLSAVEDVKKLLPSDSGMDAADTLELIKLFAGTWFSLDAYDRSELPSEGWNKKNVELAASELAEALAELKADLVAKGEATELFAQEKRSGGLAGIVGNVMQSVFGEDAYPTLEAKAAHLLYFIIKNHPFNDGNKRSGAFAFVWFLRKAGILNPSRISPEALTALALLVAESDPKEKDRVV